MAIFFNSYTPEWAWLSNFHPCSIDVPIGGGDGSLHAIFPTAEHLYQFSKWDRRGVKASEVESMVERLCTDMNATRAKRWGRHVPMRPNWQSIKLKIMNQVLREKFAQNQGLAERLVATDDEPLWHLAPWDQFWGVSETRVGLNRLGQLMTQQRDLLRRQ